MTTATLQVLQAFAIDVREEATRGIADYRAAHPGASMSRAVVEKLVTAALNARLNALQEALREDASAIVDELLVI